MTGQIDPEAPASNLDGIRYHVPSRSDPHVTYLVELDTFSGNGTCQCKHFECRLQPLLSRLVTPERAVEEGLVKLKAGWRVENALRCEHILTARQQFTDEVLRAIAEKERAQARRPY